jgi:hypothetical protein
MNRYLALLIALVLLPLLPMIALGGQGSGTSQASSEPKETLDDIVLSPARLELIMKPGTEQTLVVNVIYSAGREDLQPFRLIAYLNDWSLSKDGNIQFHKPGTMPNSACPWIIYSPVEMTVVPGRVHPIRVTISVPPDAKPGDHLAVLFIEQRPDNIKLRRSAKEIQTRFRLGAIFYIMVPELTRRGSLEDLKAEAAKDGILIIPTFKNEGNSHIRPLHSITITDRGGAEVINIQDLEHMSVLGGSEMRMPILIKKDLPAGTYQVRYRVNLGDDSKKLIEGRTDLVVSEQLAKRAAQGSSGAAQASLPSNGAAPKQQR